MARSKNSRTHKKTQGKKKPTSSPTPPKTVKDLGGSRTVFARSTAAANWQPPVWYVAMLVFILSSPTILSVYGHQYGYSPDLHMASVIQIGTVLLLGLFFFSQQRLGEIAIRPFPVLLPAFLLLVWALLSMIWAHNHYEGAVKLLDWGGAVLAGLLVVHTLNRKRHVLMVVCGIFAAGMFLLLLGLAQFYFDVKWVDQHAKPAITFNNKNMAAQYMLLIAPLGLALSLYFKNWNMKALCGLGGVATYGFILLTNTRGAIVAAAVQLVVFVSLVLWIEVYVRKTPLLRILMFGFIGLIAFSALLALSDKGFFGTIDQLVARITGLVVNFSTGSGETRFPIWLNTVQMFLDNLWLGVGVGNWMVEYPAYHFLVTPDIEMNTRVQHINTHQDYLEMASELGLVGILLIAWIGFMLLRRGFGLMITAGNDRYLILAIVTGLSGMAINANGSFPFQQPAPVCVFMIFLALLDLYNNADKPEIRPWFVFSARRHARWLSVLSLVTVLSLIYLHYRWYQSEIYFRRSIIASRSNDFNAMLTYGLKSLEYTPNRQRMGNFVGSGFLRRGEASKAVDAYDKVLAAYPNMMHTLRNAAQAYNSYGDPGRALELMGRLLEVRPAANIHWMYAVQLIQMGRYQQAVEYFEKARQLDKGSAPGKLTGKERRTIDSFLRRYQQQQEQQSP